MIDHALSLMLAHLPLSAAKPTTEHPLDIDSGRES
jgi:hypothetical protein